NSCLFGYPRAERVMNDRNDENFRSMDKGSQECGLPHGNIPDQHQGHGICTFRKREKLGMTLLQPGSTEEYLYRDEKGLLESFASDTSRSPACAPGMHS